jgi:DNA-binding NarL/FixJ family response regulator
MPEETLHPKDLSAREQDVIRLLMQGKSNKEIALALKISRKTNEEHLTSIYSKIGVRSRAEAILWGLAHLRDFPH